MDKIKHHALKATSYIIKPDQRVNSKGLFMFATWLLQSIRLEFKAMTYGNYGAKVIHIFVDPIDQTSKIGINLASPII